MSASSGRSRLVRLYAAGVLLNLLYLAVLYACPVSRRNVQLPEGAFANNLWGGSDVMTYVEPARNFLAHGVFGDGATPDFHRTVGYPLFLAACMRGFGDAWVLGAQLVQALLFALAYPALDQLSRLLFADAPPRTALLFVLLAGTYWATLPALLTDLFFAVCLTLGMACGLRAVVALSWSLWLLQLLFMGYAAQVRPTLIGFALVYLPLLMAVARGPGGPGLKSRKVRLLIATSVIAVALLGNGPSLRNLANHGFFHPSDAFEVNLFKQLARRVALEQGQRPMYEMMRADVDAATGFRDWVFRQREAAAVVLRSYPGSVLRIVAEQAVAELGSTHLLKAANLWGLHWADNAAAGLRRSRLLLVLHGVSYVLHALLEVLFLLALLRLWRARQALLAASLLALVCYFLVPAFVDSAGARMRLPVEGILVIGAAAEAQARRLTPRRA